MIEYYVFDTEATAISAELYIRQVGQMPITGVNALTGELQPHAAKTEQWATPAQRLDGKWCFARVPANVRANIPAPVQAAFDTNYPHVVETYSTEWFEQITENE
jgi:hypothetical protein